MAKEPKLVRIIRENPGCHAVIDNDCWWLYREDPSKNPHDFDEDEDAYEKWRTGNLLYDSDEEDSIGDGGYGSGSSYGGDLLQALAMIVGIKVELV